MKSFNDEQLQIIAMEHPLTAEAKASDPSKRRWVTVKVYWSDEDWAKRGAHTGDRPPTGYVVYDYETDAARLERYWNDESTYDDDEFENLSKSEVFTSLKEAADFVGKLLGDLSRMVDGADTDAPL